MRFLIIFTFLITNSLASETISINNVVINKELKKYDGVTFLDAKNKQAVLDLIIHEKKKGTAIIGIFHDENVRDALGTTFFDIEKAKKAA